MSHTIPFHQEIFRPKSIIGNDKAHSPVLFYLSQIGGPDLARIKALTFALGNVALRNEWDAETLKSAISSFEGAAVFANAVDRIDNFSIPEKLAIRLGFETPGDGGPFAITTGAMFEKVVPYQTILSLEVAFAIGKLSDEGDIDPRFFASLITSSATPATRGGSVGPVPHGFRKRGIAGSRRAKGRKRR